MVSLGIDYEQKKVIDSLNASYIQDFERLGIQRPRVAVAQICLETNWLKSRIYKENNNLFGMKVSSRNWEIGENLGHAKYASTAHSLLDYRDWQKQMSRGRIFKSDEEYLYFLEHLPGERRYATDPDYIRKLKIILKNGN